MTDPTGNPRRIGTPVLSAPFQPSAPGQPQSASTGQKPDLQQLRNLRIPPTDHHDFGFPALTAAEKKARMTELDSRLAFLRTYYGPGADDDGAATVHEKIVESLKVTREVVLAFLNNGICPLDHKEFQALAIFLVKNKLPNALSWLVVETGADTLDLEHCDIGSEGVRMIADWAKNIPFMIMLDLSTNRIDADGAALLAGALPANTITRLDLGNNPLEDEGVQALGAGLHRNTSLQSLVLDYAGMKNPGIEALAGVLDIHPALTLLVVDANAFDDQGAATLATALGRNKTLSRLSVRFSELSDIGLSYFASALTSNTSLKSLKLSGQANEECVHLPYALADALAVNQTLTNLLVVATSMPDDATRRLSAAVAVNSTLRGFDLALGGYEPGDANLAAMNGIKEKVQANALIADAGLALSELSQFSESAVSIPLEVGHQIAAFTAQVAADARRSEALTSIMNAGPLGGTRPENDAGSKTG